MSASIKEGMYFTCLYNIPVNIFSYTSTYNNVYKIDVRVCQEDVSFDDLTLGVQNITQHLKWAVFMVSGGHFAAAIFDGYTIVLITYNTLFLFQYN